MNNLRLIFIDVHFSQPDNDHSRYSPKPSSSETALPASSSVSAISPKKRRKKKQTNELCNTINPSSPQSGPSSSPQTEPQTSSVSKPTTSYRSKKGSITYIGGDSSSDEEPDQDCSEDYKLEPKNQYSYLNRANRIDPTRLEKAYRFWTKQSHDLSVPLVVDPHLMDKTPEYRKLRKKKCYGFRTVTSRYPFLKSKKLLYKFHRRLVEGDFSTLMDKVQKHVEAMYDQAKANGQVVHDSHLREWARTAKTHFDPDEKFTFTASSAWVNRFKRTRGIKLSEEHKEYYAVNEKFTKPRKRYYALKVCVCDD